MEDKKQIAGWQANFDAQGALEQTLLITLANERQPMAKDTLVALTKATGTNVTIAKVRYALEKLGKEAVLAKPASTYQIEDRLFAKYVVRHHSMK